VERTWNTSDRLLHGKLYRRWWAVLPHGDVERTWNTSDRLLHKLCEDAVLCL